MSTRIVVSFYEGSSPDIVPWTYNNFEKAQGSSVQTLSSDLRDDNNDLTGIALDVTAVFGFGAGVASNATGDADWPKEVLQEYWRTDGGTQVGSFEFSGLTEGDGYSLKMAGHGKVLRDTECIVLGTLVIYIGKDSAAFPRVPIEFTGTVPAGGVIDIDIKADSSQQTFGGYINGLELVITPAASGPTITAPATANSGSSAALVGTSLDISTISLIDPVNSTSRVQTVTASTDTTATVDPVDTGEFDLRALGAGSSAIAGIGYSSVDVSAAGITAYTTEWEADDSVETPGVFSTVISAASTLTVVQLMTTGDDAANTTPGESFVSTDLLVVEDNHQIIGPSSVNGMNITYNADGTFTTDQDQTETIDIIYYSPSTKELSILSLTIKDTTIITMTEENSSNIIRPIIRGIIRDLTRNIIRGVLGGPAPIFSMPLIDSLVISTGTGPATFTRASTATFVDISTELVKTAASGEARFEADGYLSEGASTNLLLRSEELDNAVWVKTRASISGPVTSPDGATTADTIVEDTDSGQHNIRQTLSVPGAGTYTLSAYYKNSGRQYFSSYPQGSPVPGNAFVIFDVLNGMVELEGSGMVAGSSKIEDVGNGWFRCSHSVVASGAGSVLQHIYLCNSNSSPAPSYTGDGSLGISAWGTQLEELPFASSYIPTVASAVTRVADELTIPASNMPAGPNNFSISVQYEPFTLLDKYLIWTSSGETDPNRLIQLAGNNNIDWEVALTTVESNAASGTTDPTFYAVTLDEGVVSTIYKDGVAQSDTENATRGTTTPTGFRLGSTSSSVDNMYGHLKNFKIFDVALTANEVAAL